MQWASFESKKLQGYSETSLDLGNKNRSPHNLQTELWFLRVGFITPRARQVQAMVLSEDLWSCFCGECRDESFPGGNTSTWLAWVKSTLR